MKRTIFLIALVAIATISFAQTETDSIPDGKYITVVSDSTVIVNNTIVGVYHHSVDVTPRVGPTEYKTYNEVNKRIDDLKVMKRFRKFTLDKQMDFLRDSLPPNQNQISEAELFTKDQELNSIKTELAKQRKLQRLFIKTE